MENREDIIHLIHRYRQGTASEEEARRLLEYIQSGSDINLVEQIITEGLLDEPPEILKQSAELQQTLDILFERIKQRQKPASPETRKSNRILPIWLPLVAAALLVVTLWVFFGSRIMNRHSEMVRVEDISPGTNRATLTLAGGQTVSLSSEQFGIIVGDSLTYRDGSLIDPSLRGSITENTAILALSTPKGGTYQITLSDGTQVWLNAASTLKYPNRFVGTARTVEISGEAYFEVAEDKGRPFKVISNGQEIEVLGTQFNLTAYPEELETKTTLVEGAVQVLDKRTNTAHKLAPGEQAVLNTSTMDIRKVDILPYTAWKDGLMVWTRASLPEAIRQIERWYDVEFELPTGVSMGTLSAAIPREVNLSEVLAALELNTELKFTIEGRRVVWIK